MKYSILLFLIAVLLTACNSAGESSQVDEKSEQGFEVSFDNGWYKINSYRFSDDGKIYYVHVRINPSDTVHYADTLIGVKTIEPFIADSIRAIITRVVADSIIDEDIIYYDVGAGFVHMDNRDYVISNNPDGISELFRIEEFVVPDSNSRNDVDVSTFNTLMRLRHHRNYR